MRRPIEYYWAKLRGHGWGIVFLNADGFFWAVQHTGNAKGGPLKEADFEEIRSGPILRGKGVLERIEEIGGQTSESMMRQMVSDLQMDIRSGLL